MLKNKSFPKIFRFLGKKVLWFLGIVAIVAALNLCFQIAIQGMWLLGIPETEQIQSVTVSYPSVSEENLELTDIPGIELCVDMTGFLKYRLFQKADSTDTPLVTITYHLADGSALEVAASKTSVFYRGRQYVLKDDNTFANVVEGIFFPYVNAE